MICEKCKANMNWFSEDSVQGWVCSSCEWNLITTNINKIYEDMTEYVTVHTYGANCNRIQPIYNSPLAKGWILHYHYLFLRTLQQVQSTTCEQ